MRKIWNDKIYKEKMAFTLEKLGLGKVVWDDYGKWHLIGLRSSLLLTPTGLVIYER